MERVSKWNSDFGLFARSRQIGILEYLHEV